MKKQLIAGAAVLLAIGAGASWYFLGADDSEDALKLYGNVDIRQVSLAFENSERIVALHAEEGDKVRAGQVLAELDTRTLRLRIETARARIGVQEQVLLRLRNGTRPQEVDQSGRACRRHRRKPNWPAWSWCACSGSPVAPTARASVGRAWMRPPRD